VLRRLSETTGRRVRGRRHTALLVALVALFAVRPFLGDTGASAVVFSLVLLVVLLVAVLTIQVDEMAGAGRALLVKRRVVSFVGIGLAMVALGERLWVFFAPSPRQTLLGSASWLLLMSYITWSQLRSLLKQREVTGDTISMAIAVYLLLALTWGLLYIVIFASQPEAFHFATPPAAEVHRFPILIYFSLTTLATIGFGDITPLSLQARYAAVAEGIAGQFFLAVLVARLVGLQMSQAATQPIGAPADDPRSDCAGRR